MEVFSLLKFRRNSSAGGSTTTTISSTASDVTNQALESDDEASFFDLVFAAPDCDKRRPRRRSRKFEEQDNDSRDVKINCYDNDEYSFNNLSKKDGQTKSNFVESPNNVFYKRKNSPLDAHSFKSLSPISLLRSPQKFKVLMLGFKKSKSEKTEMNSDSIKHRRSISSLHEQSNRFTVKCDVEEFPISSLFSRDKSLRSYLNNERSEELSKRFSKDVVQKYLNLIKPLYVRVSKRYNASRKFSDPIPTVSPSSSTSTVTISPRKQVEEKQGSRAAAFRQVCKSLVKSRSTSSAVGIMPQPACRRDDSVQQQQDGIQSAILHCKRSYSSSSSQDCSMLSRSLSSSSQEKSINMARISIKEEKRSSI